jgi:hypothetical protein
MKRGIWHGCGTEGVQRRFCWKIPIKISHMEDLGEDEMIILK